MRRVRTVLGLLGHVITAYAGYRIALLAFPGADLRGGFLLLSPIFAISVVLMLGPWDFFSRLERSGEKAPFELEHRVKDMCEKLGTAPPEVLIDKSGEVPGSEIRYLDGRLLFHFAKWMKLPTSHQDFVLACEIAGHHYDGQRERGWGWMVAKYAILLVASSIASINLWLIIPLQSGGALSGMWWAKWYGMRRTLTLDIQAVKATGDLAGAISYIRKQASHFGFASAERRVASLQAAFA